MEQRSADVVLVILPTLIWTVTVPKGLVYVT